MSKTTIVYKDVALGAAEDAEISAAGGMDRSHADQLAFGITPPEVVTLERNAWLLNGRYQTMGDEPVAFWSSEISNSECAFENPPVITVDFDEQYSSTGLTIVFDESSENRCSLVNVKWYQNDEVKADVNFEPNATTYFCAQNVTSYNKIVITLLKTSLPLTRARVNRVVFGVIRSFGMTEIRKASITNEASLLSTELPVSVLSWTLDSREAVDYLFQLKQPMEVRNDNNLIGVYYVDTSKRLSAGVYNIECHDALGILGEVPFAGGVYSKKSAVELLTEIVDGEFSLVIEAEDVSLTGAILAGTKRDAMQQVLFAWGAVASTDGQDGIRVFSIPSDPVDIGENRTFLGASVETSSIVTKVVVYSHTYAKNTSGSVTINGTKYNDTQKAHTIENPDVTAADKQRVVEVTGATLVSSAIGDVVAQRVYDYYARRNTYSSKIVWNGERLGDAVSAPNSWGGTNVGNVSRMEIKLSNTVVANIRVVGS